MSDAPKLNERQLTVLASIRSAVKTAPTPERRCGECNRCCEGWLRGSVYGHEFSPGTPCFFMEKTCTIYADRPIDPCRNYRCAWLAEDIFPMWMKPHLSNLIITKRNDDRTRLPYYVVDVAGAAVDPRAVNWLETWSAKSGENVEFHLNGDVRRVGAPDFVAG
jgi:hypothetical protein